MDRASGALNSCDLRKGKRSLGQRIGEALLYSQRPSSTFSVITLEVSFSGGHIYNSLRGYLRLILCLLYKSSYCLSVNQVSNLC